MPTDKRQRQREGRQFRRQHIAAARRRRRNRQRGVAAGLVIVVVGVLVAVFGFSSNKSSTASTGRTKKTTTTAAAAPPTARPVPAGGTLTSWKCPSPDGSSPHISKFPATQPPMCIDPSKTYTVTLTTSEGTVAFRLDTTHTPKTANNYVVLALYHYYDGTSIDRIDTSIDILQTGSPSTQSIADPGPGYTIQDEGSGYKYSPGDVVMARSSGANSGAAQYFFVVGPKASQLDSTGTYVTFGHVTQGLNVLQKIEGMYVPCPPNAQACLGGAPSKVVTISKVAVSSS